MYDIKLGQGCGIKATMLTPAGGVCDLRRARYIAASLVLPSGATMNCEDIAFNEVTNGVYVRLLGTRELTTTGQYGIVFNVKLEDKTMYSTPVVWFAEVKEDAPTGYHELTLSLSLTVVNFPDNVSYTGASPKISDKNTWLVYDDDLNAYVDTGIEVGYANLLSRYDGKFAEIVVPCTEATNAAAAATVAANNAAAAANSAAGSASAARQITQQRRPTRPRAKQTRRRQQQIMQRNPHSASSTPTTTLSIRSRTPTAPSTSGSRHSKRRL
jgi:hypothetical protein